MTHFFHHSSYSRPINSRLISTISDTLNIALHKLSPYTHFFDDLYLDSTDMMLLIAAIERDLDIYLSPQEVASIQTIADANKLFEQATTTVAA